MNYGSGFMLGLSLAQAAKGILSPSAESNTQRKMNPMNSAFGALGRNNLGRGKQNSEAFSDFSSLQIPQVQSSVSSPNVSFELESRIYGRRRYRASHIPEELAVAMEENLNKLDYVKSIVVNPDTGSILITFDECDLEKIEKLAEWMKKHLFSENYAEYKRDRKLNQIFYGSITKSVENTIKQISHMIIGETHGLFDIRSLSSAIFAILGFRKVILNGEFPSGIQMLWWAVSLMRGARGV